MTTETKPEPTPREVRLTALAARLVEVSAAARNRVLADAQRLLREAEAEHARNLDLAAKESGATLPDGARVGVEERDGGIYLSWKEPAKA